MKSILAQLDFSYKIKQWADQGVPFRTHLYVPEVHPDTGEEFHEREDEGHVFKVCRFTRGKCAIANHSATFLLVTWVCHVCAPVWFTCLWLLGFSV